MRPIIPFFTLKEIKKRSLEILVSDFFSKFFSLRQLTDKIIADEYNIPERYLFTTSEYTPLQKYTKKQMNHCLREFKELGYISKFSNRFWIIFKDKIKKDERLNGK